MTSLLTGVPVSPGRVVGVVHAMPSSVPEPSQAPRSAGTDAETAVARVAAAVAAVQADLFDRAGRAQGAAAEVLTVTAAMAGDPTLAKGAAQRITDDGATPERAVWDAAEAIAVQLEGLGGMMAERARDARDVRDRIVAALRGLPAPGVPDPGGPFVLTASDLAPADTATLDPAKVLAIVTAGGGPTSHTAILARSLGIPAIVACAGATAIPDGTTVLVDGGEGTVDTAPSDADVAAVAALAGVVRTFDGHGRTSDGHPVALLANVADAQGADAAVAAGAEGVGLFRTEFCFLGRGDEPSVDEQVAAYRTVLSRFPGRKVVVRTLDAGADKPLAYVTADDEPNPALGVRGLRTAVEHPDVLERQLEAIAAAAAAEEADVWVMAPMVATVAETEEFVERCAAHGLGTAGVMVEVPAAALQSEHILAHAAFASIGTNDLTQYCMAADRETAALAGLSTGWQPAVLQLVAATCRGGAARSAPIGVCGEAAGDPALAVVLVGLGVSSLSMTPRALADVAAVLASVDRATCERLAHEALAQPDAVAARSVVRAGIPALAELAL